MKYDLYPGEAISTEVREAVGRRDSAFKVATNSDVRFASWLIVRTPLRAAGEGIEDTAPRSPLICSQKRQVQKLRKWEGNIDRANSGEEATEVIHANTRGL